MVKVVNQHRTGLGGGFFCGCGSGYGIGFGFGLGFPVAKLSWCTVSVGTGVGCGVGFGAGLGFGLYWNSFATMQELEREVTKWNRTLKQLWSRFL